MGRVLRLSSSLPVIAGLSLPLLLWLAWLVFLAGLSPLAAADTFVVKLYYTTLAALLGVRAALAFRSSSHADALLSLTFVALLLHGAYVYATRSTVSMSIGLGEEAVQYDVIDAGPWSRLDRIPLVLKDGQPGREDAGTVMLDGREQQLIHGQPVRWRDRALTLTGTYTAPLFILSDHTGKELDAGYIKLRLDAAGQDFFQYEMLPHRFYVSRPGRERETWKKEGGRWNRTVVPGSAERGADGEMLHLMVIRGKLVLFDGDVKRGERVPFDGYAIRFEQGAPWVEIRVEKTRHRLFLYAACGLSLAGSLLLLVKRRTA
ncbi:MAG: hypothetical protein OHK006_06290 [Thermodesulfovibrionales bacterium]